MICLLHAAKNQKDLLAAEILTDEFFVSISISAFLPLKLTRVKYVALWKYE